LFPHPIACSDDERWTDKMVKRRSTDLIPCVVFVVVLEVAGLPALGGEGTRDVVTADRGEGVSSCRGHGENEHDEGEHWWKQRAWGRLI
jgi:hypothetical protein